jgi:hypothetical protein
MRCAMALLLIGLICAPPARAGAWMREKGSGFMSAAATLRTSDAGAGYETRFYGEYGLTPRLTVGLDLNQQIGAAGHALGFLRLPLNKAAAPLRLAVELGVGAHNRQGQWLAMGKATLSLGYGFEGRWGNGWLALDTAVENRTGNPDLIYKFDATLGLSSGPRIRPVLKLETAYMRGSTPGWALTPAMLIDTGKTLTWLVGIERRFAGQTSTGITIELWRSF